MPPITKRIEATFANVIVSPKNAEENIIPNADDEEKINNVLIAPINFRATMKKKAAKPVPTIDNTTIAGTWDQSTLKGTLNINIKLTAKTPDTNEDICVILLASSLLLTYLQRLMSRA